MYYAQPRAPRDDERRLIDVAADIARIAIEQRRAYAGAAAQRGAQPGDPAGDSRLDVPDHARRRVPRLPRPGRLEAVRRRRRPSSAAPSATCCRPTSPTRWPRPSPAPSPPTSRRRSSTRSTPATASGFFEAIVVTCDGDKILSMVRDITDRQAGRARSRLAPAGAGAPRPRRHAGRAVGHAGARAEPAADRRPQQRAGGAASARPRSARRGPDPRRARRHHPQRQAGRRGDRAPALAAAQGRFDAAAGRSQRGGPRDAGPGRRRAAVPPRGGDPARWPTRFPSCRPIGCSCSRSC